MPTSYKARLRTCISIHLDVSTRSLVLMPSHEAALLQPFTDGGPMGFGGVERMVSFAKQSIYKTFHAKLRAQNAAC